MNYIFVIAIVGAAIMVIYSLVRGLIAFVQTNEATKNGEEMAAMYQKQNQMMSPMNRNRSPTHLGALENWSVTRFRAHRRVA